MISSLSSYKKAVIKRARAQIAKCDGYEMNVLITLEAYISKMPVLEFTVEDLRALDERITKLGERNGIR